MIKLREEINVKNLNMNLSFIWNKNKKVKYYTK